MVVFACFSYLCATRWGYGCESPFGTGVHCKTTPPIIYLFVTFNMPVNEQKMATRLGSSSTADLIKASLSCSYVILMHLL